MKKLIILVGCLTFLATLTFAELNKHVMHKHMEEHQSVGAAGEHIHKAGETMFSYRYMNMSMDGNRNGQTQASVSDVLTNYMVAPLQMTMGMHMFAAMFAPNDRLTVMAMLPYISKSMDHRKRDLTEFNRQSNGLGDLNVSGLYNLQLNTTFLIQLKTGLSLPLGSIDEKDGQSARLPYPMQIGSGTTDLDLGVTLLSTWRTLSLGSQVGTLMRLGKNKHDYALGNQVSGAAWVSKYVTRSLSASLRTQAKIWGDISGADSDLNPNMVPTATTDRGGKQLDVILGLNYQPKQKSFKGNRVGIQIGKPILQSLDGVQLETDWWLALGWQYTH